MYELNMSCLRIWLIFFFFQAEDGILDLVLSRGLGDVYKRQIYTPTNIASIRRRDFRRWRPGHRRGGVGSMTCEVGTARVVDPGADSVTLPRRGCLLYTYDAADDLLCVDLGGRRIMKKKNKNKLN